MNSTSATKERLYLGRTRAERDAQRRRQLLDAGLQVFCDRGFSNTRVNDVCTAARVTGRSFYEHFESLEALVLAIYAEVTAEVFTALAGALQESSSDPEVRIRAGIDAYVRTMAADESRLRFMFVTVVGATPEIEAARRRAEKTGRQILQAEYDRLRDSGLVAAGATEMTFGALIGAISQSLVFWVEEPDRPSLDALIDELVHIYRAVIIAPREEGGTDDGAQ